MMIYFHEVDLEEGFRISSISDRHSRLVRGREVSQCSGILLFQHLHAQGQQIKCWNCDCVADRWVAEKGMNDHKNKPVLNLYGVRTWPANKKRNFAVQEVVLMTRDHIIPKFLGGVDSVENLRPGCSVCNSQRGHQMNDADIAFMHANPHLVSQHRLETARKKAEKHERRERERREAKAAKEAQCPTA